LATGGPAAELARINAELATLMSWAPARLSSGTDRSLADPLVICGILGGKDVGKSTLINALAGQRVSGDDEEVGWGTLQPMAYVHRDSVSLYRSRLAGADSPSGSMVIDPALLEVTEHQAQAIRHLVLVDLPDFDSDLPRHLEIVRAMAPLLDRLIWVVTPRKIGDRAWVALYSKVVKDRQNVHCVLNKADELLGDESPAGLSPTFLQDQLDWARQTLDQSGCPAEGNRLFVVAAEAPTADHFVDHIARRWDDPNWSIHGTEREAVAAIGRQLAAELVRLREGVLSPVSPGDAQSLKQANQQAETRRNAEVIQSHFRLEEWARRLQRAGDAEYHQTLLNDAFGSDFCTTVGRRLRASQRTETELADDLLVGRVDHWPILPIIFWPMRWLVRRLGARFAGTRWTGPDSAIDALTVRGQSLEDRLQVYLTRVQGDHSRTIQQFRLADRLPDVKALARRITSRATSLVADLDDDLLASLKASYRRPAFPKRWLLWAMLIWFPLVQPLTEGVLKLLGAGGKIDILGGALQVVMALGATHLLTGLAFVAFVYFIILATMYARCVRQVRRSRHDAAGETNGAEGLSIAEGIDDLLVSEVVGGAVGPFVEIEQTLNSLRQRLERLY
jgi:hypothetical protein